MHFVEKNGNKAFFLFNQASQSDSKYKDDAKYMLPKFYKSGWGGAEKDCKKAYDIYLELLKSKSDFQDDAKYCLAEKSRYQNNAEFWLAHCYDNGNGVTKNKDKALQLYLELLKSKEYRLK
ncbi:6255_t:CDS:2, partial [Gigaspora rosea]